MAILSPPVCDKCDYCLSLCDALNAAIETYNILANEGSPFAPSQLIAVAKAQTALTDCRAFARTHHLTRCPEGTGTGTTGTPPSKNCPPCPPCEKNESLTIIGVEQTQATQYWNLPTGEGSEPPSFDNTVPLVENKATVLRVYVDATTTQSIKGSLTITQGGVLNTSATNNSPLGTIAGIPAAGIVRNEVDDTLNFLLPAAICTGTLGGTLSIQTANGSVIVTQTVELTFQAGLQLHLHVVQVATSTSITPTPAPLFDFVQRAFPVSEFTSSTSTLQWPAEVDTLDQFAQVLEQVSLIRAALVNPNQTTVAVGIIQGTTGLNYGTGVGASLCALFYAGNIATDGAHWVARSLGIPAAACDNPPNVPPPADLQLTFNEIQSAIGIVLDQVGKSPTLTYVNETIVPGTPITHTMSQGPIADGSKGDASTTFEATFDNATNILKLGGTVHIDGIGTDVNTAQLASTRTEAHIWTPSPQNGIVSFTISNTTAILNYSKFDTTPGGHGRFDVTISRVQGTTLVPKYYWGSDPNDPNLQPDSGFLAIPIGSYIIDFGLDVGAGSETGQPLPPPSTMNIYSEDRSAGVSFGFITGDVPPTASPGATGLIPETGFDDVLLRTYPTTDFYDLMTTCSPRWISPETYTAILQAGLTLAGNRATGPVLRGLFRVGPLSEHGHPSVTLSQWLRLDVAELLPERKSDLSLQVLNASRGVMTVIDATRLPSPFDDDSNTSPTADAWYCTTVPAAQAIAAVRPVFRGKPLEAISLQADELKIELSPPRFDSTARVVNLALTVRGAADDSALRWAVRCGVGEAWFPVVAGVGAPGDLSIPVDQLPAGDRWQFEAIAYAGVHSALAKGSAIRARRTSTTMRIVYPASGTEIHQNEVLRLYAMMSPSSANMSSDDVVWTSSAAGMVSNGLSTSTHGLPPGRQQIKVIAALASGELVEDTVFVNVVRGKVCGCKTKTPTTKRAGCGCHK